MYDLCVFNKDSGVNQISIYLHVDDMLVTSLNNDSIKELHLNLQKKFGSMVLHEGKVHSFLGMSLDFSETGTVQIVMDKFIGELLNKASVPGTASALTPAGDNLFVVREDAIKVNESKQEKLHSWMASLLYLCKHGRPDLSIAVCHLSRRVGKFDVDDEKKIRRVFFI
jgi:hypothetical protein